jgi:hypothetical protein
VTKSKKTNRAGDQTNTRCCWSPLFRFLWLHS